MKFEIKSIPIWAFLKISFFVNLISGFILGVLLAPFVGVIIAFLDTFLKIQGIDIQLNNSLDAIVVSTPLLLSFGFAFLLTFFEIIVIVIYNIFARFVGGMTVNLETEQVEQLQTQINEQQYQEQHKQKTKNRNNSIAPLPLPPVLEKDIPKAVPVVEEEIAIKKEEPQPMNESPVRVRIAPSPSGYLHVGTARMAIANFLYARHTGGQFLIRIENTDAARSDESLIEPIISALKWLGIESDEKIIYQSDRIEEYKKYAQKILDDGNGYRCFCSAELLAADREEASANKAPQGYNKRCLHLSQDEINQKLANGEQFAIRLKIPEGQTTFTDLVSSELKRDNVEIEDFIIARSDGTATYNLAVVVDDHDMRITHVVRGNDHVTNTFKQIHIYKALGFDLPVFGHVPLILRPDKKKVSKRLGDKDVAQYRDEGILPEAMFNFLCLLGWSPKTDREIYTVDELIKIFNPNNFNNSNAIFDEDKLEAFNKEHIAMKSDHDLAVLVAPMLVEAGYTSKYWLETRWEYFRDVVAILKTRVRRIQDFVELGKYFFEFDFKYDTAADEKNFTPEAVNILEKFSEKLAQLEVYTKETIEAALTALSIEMEIKKGQIIHPARLAVSGTPNGPGLYDLLFVLGQEAVVERMKKAIIYIKKK